MFGRFIFLLSFLSMLADSTAKINSIQYAAYNPLNLVNALVYNGTCNQCICYAFFSNNSIDYTGLNCYENRMTCILFQNLISKLFIQIDINSIFIYKSVESQQTTDQTTSMITTTSSFQCFVPQWNTTGVTFASTGTNLNQIKQAYGLFIVEDSDILYIADSGNNRILRWSPNDTSAILVAGGQGPGSNQTQLNNPIVVYVDQNENIYVGDSGNYRIQYFQQGSSFGRTIAGNGTEGSTKNLFGSIFGLGVDLANNVYVADYDNYRITKWLPNATFGIIVAGNGTMGNSPNQLNTATAFYVDRITGTLYVPNQGSHCVTKWLPGSSTGIVVAGICGTQGSNETLLNSPRCVTFDKYGNMYVIDLVNNGRILLFCPNSIVGIPIVTTGLNNPISIAIDKYSNIYITDYGNNRIVKYSSL